MASLLESFTASKLGAFSQSKLKSRGGGSQLGSIFLSGTFTSVNGTPISSGTTFYDSVGKQWLAISGEALSNARFGLLNTSVFVADDNGKFGKFNPSNASWDTIPYFAALTSCKILITRNACSGYLFIAASALGENLSVPGGPSAIAAYDGANLAAITSYPPWFNPATDVIRAIETDGSSNLAVAYDDNSSSLFNPYRIAIASIAPGQDFSSLSWTSSNIEQSYAAITRPRGLRFTPSFGWISCFGKNTDSDFVYTKMEPCAWNGGTVFGPTLINKTFDQFGTYIDAWGIEHEDSSSGNYYAGQALGALEISGTLYIFGDFNGTWPDSQTDTSGINRINSHGLIKGDLSSAVAMPNGGMAGKVTCVDERGGKLLIAGQFFTAYDGTSLGSPGFALYDPSANSYDVVEGCVLNIYAQCSEVLSTNLTKLT